MSILIVHVKKTNLKKGQKCYVAFKRVKEPRKIDRIVFWDEAHIYATPVMHGISRDDIELTRIFENYELGITTTRRKKFEKKIGEGAKATWINWDYPDYFEKEIYLNTEPVKGFRVATKEEEEIILRELKECSLE